MTNNGSSYIEERRKTNENNLKRWQEWSYSINYVVEQFNDVVANLSERLSIAENTIEALNIKINNGDMDYVKLQYDNIQIPSSNRQYYTRTCGVFSNVTSSGRVIKPNNVYVFATQSNQGVFVNNVQVVEKHNDEDRYYEPFLKFSGSDTGTIITIKTDNAEKIGNNLDLYFSINSSLRDNSIGEDNNDIAKLSIKINYSQLVVKDLITLDKSKLGQTIITKTPIPAEMQEIVKYGIQVGQYSAIKTAAATANRTTTSSNGRSTTRTTGNSTTRR